MRSGVYILVSLAVVAALHFSGVMGDLNITHPIWQINATLYGSLGGAALSALVFWVCAAKPRLGRGLQWLVMLGFVAALAVTLLSARAFISAEEFDPVALGLWRIGSYAVFASFVAALAALLAKQRIIGSRAAR